MKLYLYFKAHYKAGQPGYYDGRQRATVAVWHDSQLWLYFQPVKSRKKEFKTALEIAFCKDGEKLTGSYPEFTVK